MTVFSIKSLLFGRKYDVWVSGLLHLVMLPQQCVICNTGAHGLVKIEGQALADGSGLGGISIAANKNGCDNQGNAAMRGWRLYASPLMQRHGEIRPATPQAVKQSNFGPW